MDFKRRAPRGKNSKHWKWWFDETRQYRITWRDEVFDVAVEPAYYAAILCRRSLTDKRTFWDFAGAHRPYKTFKAAREACELNHKIWEQFIALGQASGNRIERLKQLEIRSRVGNKPFTGKMLSSLPLWVRKQGDSKLIEMLFPQPRTKVEDDDYPDESMLELSSEDQSDTTETSNTTASPSVTAIATSEPTKKRGRASSAPAPASPTENSGSLPQVPPTKPKRAKRATPPDVEPKPPVKRRTTKRSVSTKSG